MSATLARKTGFHCPDEHHFPRCLQLAIGSADLERHVASLHEGFALGFDRVYLHNFVRDRQERFIDLCAERLSPALTEA
jgi:hypothetical protein